MSPSIPPYTASKTAASSPPSGGTSENNRKAKYYRISLAGKKHLANERSRWNELVMAVGRVLGPATE